MPIEIHPQGTHIELVSPRGDILFSGVVEQAAELETKPVKQFKGGGVVSFVEQETVKNPYKIKKDDSEDQVTINDIDRIKRIRLYQRSTAQLQQSQWQNATPSEATIPEIIHFVWIGDRIPDDRLNKIRQWKDNHLTYRVWVWSDSRWKDPLGKIKNGFGLSGHDLMKYTGLVAGVGAELKDVRSDTNIFTEYYQKEAGLIPRDPKDPNGAWANFGTASDLLRYYILNKYGGIYADSDLGYKKPGSLNMRELNDKINKPRNDSGGNPIQLFLHNRSSESFTKLTNDLIISPPNNPAIQQIIADAHRNLDELYSDSTRLAEYPKTDDGHGNRLLSPRAFETQRTTGPEAVRIYLEQYYRLLSGTYIPWNRIGCKFDALDITPSSGSDQSWLLNEVPTPGNKQPMAKSQSLAYSSVFPHRQMEAINYEDALAYEPILLNGMKVIFDQPVSVYPVTLESKAKERRNGSWN